MIGRILFVIGGFLIVYSGISVILNRFFHYFGQIVVLSESYFSIGILIILLGIGFIYLGSRKKFTYGEKYVKCIDCGAIYTKKAVADTCGKCDGDVDDLDCFYIRHPELRGPQKIK